MRGRLLWGTALVVLVLDQASKFAVLRGLRLQELGRIEVLPPWLSFRMAWNRGVNFGLLSTPAETMRWILIAVALAVALWVALWAGRRARHPRAQLAAGLLIGGALGNALDRLLYGAVADFLNMSCCGIDNPYAFNLADVAIFAGAAGLILWGDGGPKQAGDGGTGIG